MNLIDAITGGHPSPALRTPEINLLVKLSDEYGIGSCSETPVTVTNPYSGASVVVNGGVAALIEFVYAASGNNLRFNGHKIPVSIFDRVRYLVMKLDSAAYYAILD